MSHSLQIINKGWDKDLLGYIAAATALGTANKMSYDQRWKVNRLIVQLKEAGIWEQLDLLYLLACDEGTTSSTNTHIRRINLIDKVAAVNRNANTYTILSNTGIKGDNGLDTGYNPSTEAVNFAQNNASIFSFVADNAQSSSQIGQVASNNITLAARTAADVFAARLNNTTVVTVANTDSTGFWHIQRLSSTGLTIYKDGSSWATPSSTSNALTASAVTINGNATNYNQSTYLGFAGLGSGLSGLESTLSTIWYNYFNSL